MIIRGTSVLDGKDERAEILAIKNNDTSRFAAMLKALSTDEFSQLLNCKADFSYYDEDKEGNEIEIVKQTTILSYAIETDRIVFVEQMLEKDERVVKKTLVETEDEDGRTSYDILKDSIEEMLTSEEVSCIPSLERDPLELLKFWIELSNKACSIEALCAKLDEISFHDEGQKPDKPGNKRKRFS